MQDGKGSTPYIRSFLKKVILEIESAGDVVADELYEQFAFSMTSLKVHMCYFVSCLPRLQNKKTKKKVTNLCYALCKRVMIYQRETQGSLGKFRFFTLLVSVCEQ